MDAFRWVKRDSYLPAGSHGLKVRASPRNGARASCRLLTQRAMYMNAAHSGCDNGQAGLQPHGA